MAFGRPSSAETMTPATIAIVDDAEVQRRILTGLLGKHYQVASYASGEVFLREGTACDLVLLDIDMPGVSGYDVCRHLRMQDATRELPVIFVSGHDTTPERVAAYEAGGDDFIIKPVAPGELLHKVEAVLTHRRTLAKLAQNAASASRAADVAQANVGALETALQFLRRSLDAKGVDAVADLLVDSVRELGLPCAVQIRTPQGIVERNALPSSAPLQTSVMESMRGMGRVFTFGTRGIINHEHVSLLVTDLPSRDPARLERLRGELAMLGEAAAARIESLLATARADGLANSAAQTLGMLEKVLSDAAAHTRAVRRRGQQQTMEMLDMLGRMIEGLDLNDLQRQTLHHTIEDGIEALANLNEEAALADDQFAQVIARLRAMSAHP